MFIFNQRKANISLSARAKPHAWRGGYSCFANQEGTELHRTHLSVRLRNRRPSKHGSHGRFHLPSDARQARTECITAYLIDLVDLDGIVLHLVQCDGGSNLNRLKSSVIQIGLELGKSRYDLRITQHERHAPTGHRERLRHGVQLHRYFLCALCLQNGWGSIPIKPQVGIGVVVNQNDVSFAGKVNNSLHERKVDTGSGWVMRKGQHDDSRSRVGVLPSLDHVLKEFVSRSQRDLSNVCTCEQRPKDMDRIARRRYQGGITVFE